MAQSGRDKSNKLKQAEITSIISSIFEDVLEDEVKVLQTRLDKTAKKIKTQMGKSSSHDPVDLKARSFLQAIDLIGESDAEEAPEDIKEEEPEALDQQQSTLLFHALSSLEALMEH